MEIFELAAELGKKLKEDVRLTRLEEARVAYEKDEKIVALTAEYGAQQQALQAEGVKEEPSEEVIAAISARVDELVREITESEVYKTLEAAQDDVNRLMSSVNATINAQITGEEPGGCTHNCATCGGCH